MNIKKYISGFVVLAWIAVEASAAPVTYTFTGNWTNSPTGDFGATYIATLILDNGGSSAANQTFGQADFVSARVESGAYDFTMTPGEITSWDTDFSSNTSGEITIGWFDAQSAGNTWHFDLEFQDENFSNSSSNGGYFESHTSNPGTVGVAAVPTQVPTMPVYGLILTSVGLLMTANRRLKKTPQLR